MADGNNKDAQYLSGLLFTRVRKGYRRGANPLISQSANSAAPVVLKDLLFDAIGERVSQRNTANSGANTAIFTYPATPAQGSLLVACLSWRSNATISSIPSGWFLATSGGDNTGLDSAIYYKVAGASEPTGHTFTFSAAIRKACAAFEFSGVNTLDKTNSNFGNSTAGTTGSTGVLSVADELVVALFSNQVSTETWSAHDNGLAEIAEIASTDVTASNNANISVASKVTTVTDSVNYGATLSLSRVWSTAVATFRAPGVGDVSVNLTGQGITANAGQLPGALNAGVAGQSVAATQGSVTASQATIVNLTGQSLSVAPGTLNKSIDRSVSGQAGSVAQGAVNDSLSIGITGQSVSSAAGTVAYFATVTLSGQSASLGQGNVSAGQDTIVSLTGQSVSAVRGSLSNSQSATLPGQLSTVAQGSINKTIDRAVTGQSASIAQGSTVAGLSQPIAGQSLNIGQGSIAKTQSATLTGQQITTTNGSVTATFSFTPVGQQVTAGRGNLTVEGANDVIVSLTGLTLGISTGTLLPSLVRSVTGQSLSTLPGSVSVNQSLSLTGQQVLPGQGTFTSGTTRAVSGQSVNLLRGSLFADSQISVSGYDIAVTRGLFGVGYFVGIDGQQTDVLTGIINAIEGGFIPATPSSFAISAKDSQFTITARDGFFSIGAKDSKFNLGAHE